MKYYLLITEYLKNTDEYFFFMKLNIKILIFTYIKISITYIVKK